MNEIKLNTPYQPVSCDLHSKYELAIMHKNKLRLSWLEAGGEVTEENILAPDLQAKSKAEYLIATTAKKNNLCIRLDHVTELHILK